MWKFYFQNTSRVFLELFLEIWHISIPRTTYPYTKELDKTMEIGFSDLFLQYFQNIYIVWKRPIFSSVLLTDINATVELLSIIKDDSCATVSLPGT